MSRILEQYSDHAQETWKRNAAETIIYTAISSSELCVGKPEDCLPNGIPFLGSLVPLFHSSPNPDLGNTMKQISITPTTSTASMPNSLQIQTSQTGVSTQTKSSGNTANIAGVSSTDAVAASALQGIDSSRQSKTQVSSSLQTTTNPGQMISTSDEEENSTAVSNSSVSTALNPTASQRFPSLNQTPPKKHVSIGVLVGAVIGSFMVLLIIGLLFWILKRRFRTLKNAATEHVSSYKGIVPHNRWSVASGTSGSGTCVTDIYQTLDLKLSAIGYPQSILKDSEGYGYGYGYGFREEAQL